MMALSMSVNAGLSSDIGRRAVGSAVADITPSPLQVGFVAEQYRVGCVAQIVVGNHFVELAEHAFPADAVNHAKKIVGPVWQSSRSLVTQGNKWDCRQGFAQFADLVVRYIPRSEEHTSELQSRENLVCRLLLEKKKHNNIKTVTG